MREFTYKYTVPASIETVFEWHRSKAHFHRILPPWEKIQIIKSPTLCEGSNFHFVRKGQHYLGEVLLIDSPNEFTYKLKGNFLANWRHNYSFKALDKQHTEIIERVRFVFKGWHVFFEEMGINYLHRITHYKKRVLQHDFELARNYPCKLRTVAITGSTGFIGKKLHIFLESLGFCVKSIVRNTICEEEEIKWDPYSKYIDSHKLEGVDVVIHLSGKSVIDQWWSSEEKKQLFASRVESTKFLAESLQALNSPPSVFICASAIGYYGDRGSEELVETSTPGEGFVADMVRSWEDASHQYTKGRVVNMRLGVVLDPQGGALAQMLLPFKLGLGGPLGSGKQWVSWIGMDDLLYQIYQLFVDNSIEGPINIVSPNPVTNQQFSQILASCYNKPSVLRVPKLVLQTLKGEMAKEILLSSQKVHPKMLLDNNFKISYPDLNQYLDHTLGLV